MNPLDFDEVNAYVNENIVFFHRKRLDSLKGLKLRKLLTKNPYLSERKISNLRMS